MSIYDDFFNFEKPCPETVKNCDELRDNYKNRLQQIESDTSCNGCKKLNLKAEFMTHIWKGYLENIGY